ncbi:hypothetical protein Acid345_0207 [Candidatus Koribacter versatilis Ellin345]|uniref:Transporter n=1 Tax=Koribacter versatilis (strain Ellin345) TaxID=204669 RepID=Q1IV88_KORVE|nr:transporter [Candidatus Koribacter versatilis]ABF39212.1 hypothetical protein Acid345_0207 [Candidatus Koribacter versatilis Ellin345]
MSRAQFHWPTLPCTVAGVSRVLVLVFALLVTRGAHAQDLTPRAYLITPLHGNAITMSYSYFNGALDFNNVVPITDGSGEFSVPSVAYYHSFNFFGRSANFLAALPYGVGNFEGLVLGRQRNGYRSGLLDSVYRVSVNLKGGPAMELPEFMKWKQKTLLGVSLKVVAPTGQYNPDLLINWGTNRWAFKPEFGYSRRFSEKWVLDAYAGAWFFTDNSQFFSVTPPPAVQSLSPIGSFEGHLSRNFTRNPLLWASLDGNFWFGGQASNNNVPVNGTRQTASRIGGTGSFPLTKSQSIKVSFNSGAYVRFGGNYKNLSVGWQYAWFGHPK